MALRVLLCDAAKDENGLDGYEGSIAGNQYKLTGDAKYHDEVRTINYVHVREFWWKNRETRVYRCKRTDLANAIAIRMKQTADNPHSGYSQPNRKGIYEELKKDPDPSHIKRNIEMDCSSSVNTCVWVTFKSVHHPETAKINPLARTKDMPAMYDSVGEFINVTKNIDLSTGAGLKKGDILVIPNNHTACVWSAEELPDPEYNAVTTTELYLRTGPGVLYKKCNIQIAPDYKVRNYLYAGEKVRIVEEKDGWCRLECVGIEYTWYPWCSKKYLEKL